MEGAPGRAISSSEPSGRMRIAFDPVVLARTRAPDSRSPAAMSRVTPDLPRVPATAILSGILRRALSSLRRSTAR